MESSDFARVPGGLRAAGIEWTARQITDPVERLRFLRKAAARPSRLAVAGRVCGRIGWLTAVVAFAVLLTSPLPQASSSGAVRPRTAGETPAGSAGVVWAVERTAAFDLYSNGLRIENEFAASGERLGSFPVYRHDSDEPAAWRSGPVGVVFHSTESDRVPFAESHAGSLKRIGRELLHFVRKHGSYHFVIDRFGRVYRIVRETDKANHAGNSIWADRNGSVINLNASFLGVAFEAQTGAADALNAPQVHAGRLLTDMLRSVYRLDAANFVTHAQVSVNPSNLRIGYHTDWAAGLPFEALGLPDNYGATVPSVAQFGFYYDQAFLQAMGGTPWAGLHAAREDADRAADAAGLSPREYRRRLQERYKRIWHARARVQEGRAG